MGTCAYPKCLIKGVENKNYPDAAGGSLVQVVKGALIE